MVVALVYSFPTASTGAGLVGTTCPLHFPEPFFISRLVYPSELSSRSSDIDFVVDDEPIGGRFPPPPISTTLRRWVSLMPNVTIKPSSRPFSHPSLRGSSLTQVVERGHLHSTQPRDEEVL